MHHEWTTQMPKDDMFTYEAEGFLQVVRGSINLPLHRELDDCVEFPEQSSRSLPNLDVVTVGEAGGGGRGAQLCLSASLGFLQR